MFSPKPALLIFAAGLAVISGCTADLDAALKQVPIVTPPRVVRFSEARPLEQMRGQDSDFNLSSRIGPNPDHAFYFGQLDTTDDDQDKVTATTPVIIARRGGKWKALSLSDDRLPDAEFLFTASGPSPGEFWAVLDNQIADPADVVLLAHSRDGGESWALTTVRKPHGFGTYDSFAMDRHGDGRLTVYLTPTEAPAHPGFYSFRTHDDGRTWTAPSYEPDNLRASDDISDDENPEPLQDLPTARTALANSKSELGQIARVPIADAHP